MKKSEFLEKIREDFQDKEYRHAYADEFLNSSVATQIHVLRQQRGWSQGRLAKESHMQQPVICRIEDVNYSSWTVSTLRKLARAYDVRLRISFEEFGTLVEDFEDFGRPRLQRRPFEADPVFSEHPIEIPGVADAVTETLPDVEPLIAARQIFLDSVALLSSSAVLAESKQVAGGGIGNVEGIVNKGAAVTQGNTLAFSNDWMRAGYYGGLLVVGAAEVKPKVITLEKPEKNQSISVSSTYFKFEYKSAIRKKFTYDPIMVQSRPEQEDTLTMLARLQPHMFDQGQVIEDIQ